MTMIASRNPIRGSITACKTPTAVCMAPVKGTLALVVFLRLGLGRCSRLRLSCRDLLFFLCLGCGRFLDRLFLAIRGSPDVVFP